ncbi:hypothetical protein APE_0471c [Aeropyrum pernix K1]|uniref:Uncharacterized protein n=1 Tax=Aeropyrum pernix (strain ATCC 700893 / DSM 11879 / JCM 9820 / NBRC 100138 / K1) TaxID=272557 RepID=Q9YEW1_AERPE|nr:hypothetical protein APE_0471c [Aeropyrum pernix K1]
MISVLISFMLLFMDYMNISDMKPCISLRSHTAEVRGSNPRGPTILDAFHVLQISEL